MAALLKSREAILRLGRTGPFWIAAGIALLLAASCWPGLPVLTSVAMVALGASLAVVARFGHAGRFRPLIAVHAVVYANLYLVFVGAVCHAALTGPRHGLSWLQGVDLLVSVVLMVVAARLALGALAWTEARAAR
jgi:hypothetical protein